MDGEDLRRFPQIVSSLAEISSHHLGWRIAVLPFRSEGAAAGYGMALGMAEEISAAFSRYRSPRVIAPVTFWDGSGPAADFLGRCRMYKLDYVVDGTIEVVEKRVSVNVTLSDVVLDFEVIWSGKFVGHMDDLYRLQDCIAATTVAQLDPDLHQRGSLLDAPVKTEVAAAHHAVLTAMHWILQLNRPKFMRARELLNTAVELDPGYAAAHTWIAYWSIIAVGLGWVSEPRAVTVSAGGSAERAILLDPGDARALAIAGHVKGFLQHDVKAALALHARAVDLDPNIAIVWTLSSWSKIYNGEHSTAIRHALTAQALSPRDPHIFITQLAMTTAYFFKRQLAEAETLAEAVLARNSGHAAVLNMRLAILGHLGRAEEAADCLDLLRQLDPSVSIETIVARAPFKPEDIVFYVAGLRHAGVSE